MELSRFLPNWLPAGHVGQDIQVTFAFTVEDVVLMGRHPHVQRFKGEEASIGKW